jgi:hypothetical protein
MKKFLLCGTAILFFISAMAQNGAGLKMNLEKNKLYRLKSESEQTVIQTINGNQQTVDTKVGYSLSMKMIDQTADFMITEMHFDTLVTNTNSMGRVVKINSAVEGDIKSSETSEILSYIMNRLSKNALYVKMDFSGKPIEIVNAKMLADMVMKDTSALTLTGIMRSALKTQIAGMVSEDYLKTMIGSFTWHLPVKQVTPGADWNITQQVNSGGMKLNISNTYHVDRINGNLAEITTESAIKAIDNAPAIQSGGATITYDNLNGMSKSNMVIDILTGLVVDDKGKSHIAGTLGISAPGYSGQMPMDINGESTIKAIK